MTTATTGSCLCGTVRFEITGPCKFMAHCHCSMCRKHQGALYSTMIGVERANFRWLSGQPDIVHYRASPAFARPFCSRCGSTVPDDSNDMVGVPAGCLQDDPGIRPQAHIFVGSKSPMWDIDDDLVKFDEYPPGFGTAVERATPATTDGIAGSCTGSCLCGDVAFAVREAPTKITNCHCTRCQRSRGGAHATNVFVRQENLEWMRGADLVRTYKVPEAQLFATSFCMQCGSLLPSLFEGVKRYNVPLGSLDTPLDAKPRLHIHVKSRAAWHTITDTLPQFDEMPPREQIKEWMF
jgi:hypothetical protein